MTIFGKNLIISSRTADATSCTYFHDMLWWRLYKNQRKLSV